MGERALRRSAARVRGLGGSLVFVVVGCRSFVDTGVLKGWGVGGAGGYLASSSPVSQVVITFVSLGRVFVCVGRFRFLSGLVRRLNLGFDLI